MSARLKLKNISGHFLTRRTNLDDQYIGYGLVEFGSEVEGNTLGILFCYFIKGVVRLGAEGVDEEGVALGFNSSVGSTAVNLA